MSWVETERREQPAALERFLAAETAHATEIARGLVREDVRYLLIASRGSSSNVARYLQYLFGTVNRLTVAFATPSLYTVYEAPPELGPAAVIGISQSGASPDVVAVLDEAKRQGRPTLAITNNSRSPLAETAHWVLPLHAGEERAVAATKTYLNSIAAVALLSTVALGAELIAISDDTDFLASAQTAFPLVPDLPEWLSPLLTVVPGQVAAVQLAKLRGADIDSPIGLTKVTRTR